MPQVSPRYDAVRLDITTYCLAGRAANCTSLVQADLHLLGSGCPQKIQRNTINNKISTNKQSGSLSNYVAVALVCCAVLRHNVGYGLRTRRKNLLWGGNEKDKARGSSMNSSVSVSVSAA